MAATPLRIPYVVGQQVASIAELSCLSANVAEGSVLVMAPGTDDAVQLPSGADVTNGAIGLALLAGAANTTSTIKVLYSGIYPAVANGTITRGQQVTVGSSAGDVKAVGIATAQGAQVIGTALESATNGQRVAINIDFGLVSSGVVEQFTVGSGGVTTGTPVVIDVTANRQVIAATVADQRQGIVGIALATVAATGTVSVVVDGPAVYTASGTITRGDLLTLGTTGTLKSYTTASPLTTGINAMAIGYALDSLTNAQTGLVMVTPFQIPNGIVLPFVAGSGGVTANCAVVQDTTTNRQVVLPAAADPVKGVLGVALNTAIATAICFVQLHGVATILDSGAGMTRGDRVAIAGTNGQMKTWAIGAGTNSMMVGTAIDSIGAGLTGLAFINPCVAQG